MSRVFLAAGTILSRFASSVHYTIRRRRHTGIIVGWGSEETSRRKLPASIMTKDLCVFFVPHTFFMLSGIRLGIQQGCILSLFRTNTPQYEHEQENPRE